MNRLMLFLLICLSSTAVTGCWDRQEVNDLGLVTAIGIDRSSANEIEMSVQVFVPKTEGGHSQEKQGGAGGQQTLVRSASGITLTDAMSNLQEMLPRRLFWSHANVMIFGEDTAKAGLQEHLEVLMRSPEPREEAKVFVSKGSAKKVLESIQSMERSSSEALREMNNLKIGLDVTLKDFAQMLVDGSGASVMPWVQIKQSEDDQTGKQASGFLSGAAIFRKDKLVGFSNRTATRGVRWLKNEARSEIVTFAIKDHPGHISLKVTNGRTELAPEIRNGKWILNVQTHAEGDVLQNTSHLDLMQRENFLLVQNEFANELRRREQLTLDDVQERLHADIFRFAHAFHIRYPEEWKKHRTEWETLFPKVDVRLHVQAKITRTGMVTHGATLPK